MLDLLGYGAFFLATALTYGIICLGLNLQWGQTGLFNVGVAGFVAIGAYTSALLTTPETAGALRRLRPADRRRLARRRWSRRGSPRLSIGAITLRLRADYLAITTFGVAVCIQLVALNLAGPDRRALRHRLHPAPVRRAAGRRARLQPRQPRAGRGGRRSPSIFALERLVRSPWGRVLRGIREDEAAARRARQERHPLPPAGLRARQRHHGARRRDAGAFHRLHRAGELSLGAHLPGLGDADHRRLRQQSRRDPRRGRRLGAVERCRAPSLAAVFPPEHQARAAALQIVAIGVVLAAILVVRPRGLLGERTTVSRFVGRRARDPLSHRSQR